MCKTLKEYTDEELNLLTLNELDNKFNLELENKILDIGDTFCDKLDLLLEKKQIEPLLNNDKYDKDKLTKYYKKAIINNIKIDAYYHADLKVLTMVHITDLDGNCLVSEEISKYADITKFLNIAIQKNQEPKETSKLKNSLGDSPTNFSKKEIIKNLLKKYNKSSIKIVGFIASEVAGISSNGKYQVVFNVENDNLVIEDIITKDNIALYYGFMGDEDIKKHRDILKPLFQNRWKQLNEVFTSATVTNETVLNDNTMLPNDLFGVKDTLKPIDEYVEEIKESSGYKEYIANKSI